MKHLFSIFSLVAICLFFTLSTFAVTQKEMEEARTIAAMAYLRYANDGSGYLDELSSTPKTISELEGVIKTKEKENLSAFKSIPVPGDYKNWDKEKLVEYWAGAAFQTSGLLEKGLGGKIRAKARINNMKVSDPGIEDPVEVAIPTAVKDSTTVAETPKPVEETKPITDNSNIFGDGMPEERVSEESLKAEADSIANLEDEALLDLSSQQEKSNTWVYVLVLAILVAIVIALVAYASNVMKKSSREDKLSNENRREGNNHSRASRDKDEIIQRYAETISARDNEIAMLSNKLNRATNQNTDLRQKVDELSQENSALKMGVGEKETVGMAAAAAGVAGTMAQQHRPIGGVRSIYLGRANSKGIFVRADRTLNPGYSIYKLETTDGYSGTFKIAASPEAWEVALQNPKEYLSYGCLGHNLEDTEGKTRIITETAGTAIFEGGCWRVIRKAKIRYD